MVCWPAETFISRGEVFGVPYLFGTATNFLVGGAVAGSGPNFGLPTGVPMRTAWIVTFTGPVGTSVAR